MVGSELLRAFILYIAKLASRTPQLNILLLFSPSYPFAGTCLCFKTWCTVALHGDVCHMW